MCSNIKQNCILPQASRHLSRHRQMLLTDDFMNVFSVNDQLQAQLRYLKRLPLQSSTCLEQHCAHHKEVELYINTASGIALSVSDRPVCRLRRNFLLNLQVGHLPRNVPGCTVSKT